MDVRFSPEQVALRDSVAQVADRLGPTTVGQLDDAERRTKLDAAVTASGWCELRAAADDEGTPLASGVEVGIVAEQLGRGLIDSPFLGPTIAAELRRRAGAAPAEEAETVALRRDLVTLATDPADALAIDARGAARALVLVPDGDGFTLAAAKVQAGAEAVDLTRPVLEIDQALEPIADQARPLSADDVTATTALGLATASADLVGAMQGATTLARDYAVERKQYGVAVGSFQAVQHLLADAHVATEGSRSAALYAAWALDALDPDEALAAAASAKAYCSRAAREACETSIQVHGGIGNTWECLAHVFLRRALLSTEVLGGVGPNLERVLAANGIGAR